MLPEREKEREREREQKDKSKRDAERERGLTEDEGVRSCVVMNPLHTTSL